MCPAAEVVLLNSSFDFGDEGWTVGSLFGSDHGWLPTYVSFGGASGGYIETSDIFGFNAFHAPGSWLGNQSHLYGGAIRIHQKVLSSDGVDYPMVVLARGTLMLQYRAKPPSSDWTDFIVPLVASAGWEVGDGSGDPGAQAKEDDLKNVLARLSWFAFNADWQTGEDKVGLDSAFITMSDGEIDTKTPEPASLALSAAALGLFTLGKKLNRNRLRN